MSYYRPRGEVGERVMKWAVKNGHAEEVHSNYNPLAQFVDYGLDQLERGIRTIVNNTLKDKEQDSE